MTEQAFWEIIENTKITEDLEEQEYLLYETLRRLSPPEIIAFDTQWHITHEKLSRRLTSPLYTLFTHETNGYYISDDTWHYFVSWLIMQGKELFYAGLETPDRVLHLVEQAPSSMPRPRSLPQAETTEYIAPETYKEKTGNDLSVDALRLN